MATVPSFAVAPAPDPPKTVITKKDRRKQLLKHVVIAIVSVVTVVLTTLDVVQTTITYSNKQALRDKIHSSVEIASVIHNLQKERGLTAMYVSMETKIVQQEKLKIFRKETDYSILTLHGKGVTDPLGLNVKKSIYVPLQAFRSKIDNQKRINVAEHLKTYSSWIHDLIKLLPRYIDSEDVENYASFVFAYQMVIQSKEEAGMERALGSMYFVQGTNISIVNSTWYHVKEALAVNYLSTSFSFSREMKKTYELIKDKRNATAWLQMIEDKRDLLLNSYVLDPSKVRAQEWFDLMTKYNNLLLEVQTEAASLINKYVDDDIKWATQWLVGRSILLCFTFIVVPSLIISLLKVQSSFYNYTLSLFDKVGLEQARTDFIMQENSRYVESLRERWKSFSKTEPRRNPEIHTKPPSSRVGTSSGTQAPQQT